MSDFERKRGRKQERNEREAKEKFDELEVQAQKPGFSPLTLDYHQ